MRARSSGDSTERRAHLTTPEGIPLAFPLAGGWERMLAFVLDMTFLFGGLMGAFFLLMLVVSVQVLQDQVLALGLFASFLVRHGYFMFFEGFWNGATPGKRLLGLRVISRDGGALELEAVLARNILRDGELILPWMVLISPETLAGESPLWLQLPAVAWIVGLLALPWFTRETQRAGDLVAGTVVVRVPGAELTEDPSAPQSRKGGGIHFSEAQLAVYGEHELETLADILRGMAESRILEAELAVIAETIAKKIKYRGSEPHNDARSFLRAFYSAQRVALEKQLLRGKRKSSKLDISSK